MLSKITINNVASFKRSTTLETDKKVNLLYGLNGVGKSTLSSFYIILKVHVFPIAQWKD